VPEETIEINDLVLQATVTSRWPLVNEGLPSGRGAAEWTYPRDDASSHGVENGEDSLPSSTVRYDDETDEMDALPHPPQE
jgi:hypothetical protein